MRSKNRIAELDSPVIRAAREMTMANRFDVSGCVGQVGGLDVDSGENGGTILRRPARTIRG